jgi:SAM-dependent methyltransferase
MLVQMNAAFFDMGPFRPGRSEDFSGLRESFGRAGFTEAAVKEIVEGKNDHNLDWQFVVRRTAEPSPLHSLLRLFILGLPLSVETARSALSPVDFERLIDIGLVERTVDGVRSEARLLPWHDFFLLSDFLPAEGESLRPDFVMSGTSASSISLTRLTIRNRVRAALDIGTGAGIHALLAAAHADHVVATDVNRRALNFASMNARLNGIGNISFVEGSLFEPVAGEKFDLIVSNPPFVLSPQSALMFQNAGLHGDNVSEVIVRESPGHLNDGGCAVSLISWQHENELDWAERPGQWVTGRGCDFWLLCAASDDPLSYAANALRQTEPIRGSRYGELLDEWLGYYHKQGIVRLALGAAILRKREAARNWVHCEKLSGASAVDDAGEQIRRMFAAEDLLAGLEDDEALLDRRLALHPDHLLEQRYVAAEEGWTSQSLILKSARGIEYRIAIDARVLAFLSQCNGSRTLRELVAEVAEEGGVDFASAAAGCLALSFRLLRVGLLVVVR